MTKTQDKKRKQNLGIFYTPQEVVNFIFQILKIWKDKEDEKLKRWQSRKPHAHFPSVIDPACGEGVFLKTAITSGFTGYHPTEKTPYVFGIDLDGDVVNKWEKISILHDLFKGKKDKMLNHFHQQDGLLELPEKVFSYKIGGLKEFDAVVGNPPFGGMGFSSLKGKDTKEVIEILEHLKKFEVLGYKKRKVGNENNQSPLWGDFSWGSMPWGGGSRIPDPKEIESIPIEILFLDRFIQLAKPGGWIAIIIPDGILTSSNSHYVREFLSDKVRKLKEKNKLGQDYKVYLASIETIKKYNFDLIVKSYKKLYNSSGDHMNKSNLVQITKDQTGKEAVMIRVDRSLKNMLEEKPFSRLDVNYWHPKWDNIIQDFRSRVVQKKYLYEYTHNDNWLISTDHVRASKGEKEASNLPVEYYSPAGFLFTGYDISQIPRCSENAFERMKRARPVKDDVLLGGFGMGPTGKSLVICHTPSIKAIVGNIFILRVKDFYDPYVLDVFFKTNYGQAQFNKYKTGVAFNSLSNEEIKYLLVPEFDEKVKKSIHSEYANVTNMHNEAMEAKQEGNVGDYKEKIVIAEKMLRDLIVKTEEVIRGERSDVI
ncbi:MAG: Site specific DNA-methyltransferase [Candidatus Woesebacteria bacterium GW2011_GWA2_40_7b]|uniref:Site specific DNA-methyltransferase n=1 Tax=Candidatus Woesebacteria bacterium GW2011_GWA2_40_7b TaxID=1618563 RepID=A0A0G0T4W4_9BACT|nr:MAG: Site specific DNA-methyltransferase [Candidatus Woesebacteria bacterium GW2011_GWA2_40_7b]